MGINGRNFAKSRERLVSKNSFKILTQLKQIQLRLNEKHKPFHIFQLQNLHLHAFPFATGVYPLLLEKHLLI